ncbi:MAG: hypothetical protein A2020_15225 [Lentisphaerae bacterium GWF2_45_14]|nr:MAG: hypothetical protein A2020_15225 [Lentisphaerae bacterium GWF2_45_14]
MRRFYCENIPGTGEHTKLDKEEEEHLFRTLRAKEGDELCLMDGKGLTAVVVVGKGRDVIVCEHKLYARELPELTLFLAPPRHQLMDSLLKQCAEVGVSSIVPFITERTVSVPEKDSVLARWRKILIEGCKQSGNPYFPEIVLPVAFNEAVKIFKEGKMFGFFGSIEKTGGISFSTSDANKIAWFTGPEGGFTAKEEESLINAEIKPLNIGRWTMRAETAALCGCVILAYENRKRN